MKKEKTRNFKLKTNAGFTLLEVLIASTIFATVMVMTTATIAGSSSYQEKLTNLRTSAEETRRIADQITMDVRGAESSLSLTKLGTPAKTYKNGLALLKCTALSCTFILTESTDTVTAPFKDGGFFNLFPSINANTLVIATKNQIIYYKVSPDNRSIYRWSSNLGSIADIDTAIAQVNGSNNIISSTLTEAAINFGGYAPDDVTLATNKQQPYIQFFITSRTKNFSGLSVNQRALTQIKSVVTSRHYNN